MKVLNFVKKSTRIRMAPNPLDGGSGATEIREVTGGKVCRMPVRRILND